MSRGASTRLVLRLGSAQTLAWASTFYLPAILAAPMARELDLAVPTVFAVFSGALLASAAVAPLAGRHIDRHGGRGLLSLTSLAFALGLVMLGLARGPLTLVAAWAVLGVAMGAGLYEAAFAALVRLQGQAARSTITGITLLAGFASTIGWPLTAWLDVQLGWRGACFAWAGAHLLLGLPLNATLPRPAPDTGAPGAAASAPSRAQADAAAAAGATSTPHTAGAAPPTQPLRTTLLLAWAFAATWFISTALATHLPRMLMAAGATLAVAVAVAALVGPAQVVGRLLEFGLLRRVHPLWSARLAALAHPVGAAALLLFGAPVAALFAVLHGLGNGILTIAKGTLPLVLFGPVGYGLRQGWLTMPARLAQAAAPFAFGLALERWGVMALGVLMTLALTAALALWLLPLPATASAPVR
jgi:MFS family permease